jgi:hypothetical protein
MPEIMHIIDNKYISADEYLPIDDETGEYMGITYDQYDFIHGPLAEMIRCDKQKLMVESLSQHLIPWIKPDRQV